MAPKNHDSEIGYARPPREFQFKKGQSGNPAGRPKKRAHTDQNIFDKVLSQPVTFKSDDTNTSVTLAEGIVRQMVRLAIGGDLKAAAGLLKQMPIKKARVQPEAEQTIIYYYNALPDDDYCGP